MTEQPPAGPPPYDGGHPPRYPDPDHEPTGYDLPPGHEPPGHQGRPGQPPPGQYTPDSEQPVPALPGQSQAGLYLVLTVALVALVAGGIWWLRGQTAVDDLRVGDCLTSDDLRAGNESVAAIDVVDCNEPHDAEVVAGLVVDDATAKDGYTGSIGAQECAKVAPELAAKTLELRPLAPNRDLVAGDKVPCVVRNSDGTQLTGTLTSPLG
jgi:hypothetical protein